MDEEREKISEFVPGSKLGTRTLQPPTKEEAMTRQEFLLGPATDILNAAQNMGRLVPVPKFGTWLDAAWRTWQSISQFCRRPKTRRDKVMNDLVDMVTHCLVLARTKLDGVDATVERCLRILAQKGADYEADEGLGSHFAACAKRAGLRVEQVWLVFADKHFAAVRNFDLHGKVESEAIESRVADLANYCLLLGGMIKAGVVDA